MSLKWLKLQTSLLVFSWRTTSIMQNKNVKLGPVHERRESNQCLAIRNATHWADTRSIERVSRYHYYRPSYWSQCRRKPE